MHFAAVSGYKEMIDFVISFTDVSFAVKDK